MNNFDDLSSSLRDRLPQLLGLGMLVLVVTGELLFMLVRILPATRVRGELAAQLAVARENLGPPPREGEIEAVLQARLAQMQGALNEQAAAFLPESSVPVILDHLYRYADESGVRIIEIKAARAAGSEALEAETTYHTQTFQVEVSGSTLQLVEFVTRLQEASATSVVIDNLAIQAGSSAGGTDSLTMQLLLYTSPNAAEPM